MEDMIALGSRPISRCYHRGYSHFVNGGSRAKRSLGRVMEQVNEPEK